MEAIIEVCCGGYEDALNAEKGGAGRIELNSALHLGGLTPTLGSLLLTKRNTGLKVICMDRPRSAGFHYDGGDWEAMMEDAVLLMKNGADGLAFGCLDQEGNIDIEQTKEIVKIVHDYGGEAVFHRAFDCVKDPYASMETLIALGIDRVLTSGLKAKAMQGKDLIRDLQEKYGDRIEILAGSGMNASNAKEMMEYTGIHQVHSSCKSWCNDPTTTGEEVSYSFAPSPHENDFDVVDAQLVKELVESVK